MADWLQQSRCENEVFLSALVLYLSQWIDGVEKVVERLFRGTSTVIELRQDESTREGSKNKGKGSLGEGKGSLGNGKESSGIWKYGVNLIQTVAPILETIPLLPRWTGTQDNTEQSGRDTRVRVSTIPLLDDLRTHIKHYKASLPSVLGLGDVSGNPIPLDAQYLAEEMNMKSVLGNSRLLEAFSLDQGLASDWTQGALLVSAHLVRTLVWWKALLGEDEDVELTNSFERVVGGEGGGDLMEVLEFLERSRFCERLEGVWQRDEAA